MPNITYDKAVVHAPHLLFCILGEVCFAFLFQPEIYSLPIELPIKST